MNVKIRYFAALAEAAGKTEETIEFQGNAEELYAVLQKQYQIHYPLSQIRVAINDSYADASQTLKDADTVVFIPPVAGG